MYNPSLHTATNKPIGLTGKPVDARSYYYDTTYFVYRPYVNTSEVIGYLVSGDRKGQFGIVVNTGGSLSMGVITGGVNEEWWFKNGITDGDLVQKTGSVVMPPITTPIVSGVTPNPVVIDISSLATTTPLTIFNDTDNERVKVIGDVGLVGTSLSVLLDDDGSNKCAYNGSLVVRG